MPEIKISIEINNVVEKVYDAITKEENVKGWWTSDTTLDSEKGRFGFNPYGDFVDIIVEKLEPNKVVEWKVIDSVMLKKNEWVGTFIRFELSENKGKTILNFTHSGWLEKSKVFNSCTNGWNHFLKSLKSYLETGYGKPFKSKKG